MFRANRIKNLWKRRAGIQEVDIVQFEEDIEFYLTGRMSPEVLLRRKRLCKYAIQKVSAVTSPTLHGRLQHISTTIEQTN